MKTLLDFSNLTPLLYITLVLDKKIKRLKGFSFKKQLRYTSLTISYLYGHTNNMYTLKKCGNFYFT
jgi:hypothetical protein